MKLSFNTFLKTVELLTLTVLFGLVIFPIFSRTRENDRKSSCQSNLKQVSLGVFQYTQDWDEKYPPTNLKDTNINEKNPLGWADTLFPYLKSHQIFWCPDQLKAGVRDHNEKPPSARDYTDYFYNRRLGGQSQAVVEAVALTIMFGEGNDGTDVANARYSLHELPRQWRTDKKSPSHRHLEGGNYAFADGHVKWMKPNAVTTEAAVKGRTTFSLN
jgi:prepilin-type processing-associated H-X9-DG protein